MFFFDGHSASNWDLANPAATCSLHVLRRDSSLLIKLLAEKPKVNGPPGATEKYLFAQSSMTLDYSSSASASKPEVSMSHWIEAVVDSSRYFVVRISDEKRKKEAHIGLGFRERTDALNFKMSLQDYENTMKKEAMVNTATTDYHDEGCKDDEKNDSNLSNKDDEPKSSLSEDNNNNSTTVEAAVSKLSLKEGQKIHINLKGTSTKTRAKKAHSTTSTSSNSKPPTLLRKPPPPGANSTTTPTRSSIVVDTNSLRLSNSKEEGNRGGRDASSVAAVAETLELDDYDEDEWGDFESPSSEQE